MKQSNYRKVLFFLDDIYEIVNTKEGCLVLLFIIAMMILTAMN